MEPRPLAPPSYYDAERSDHAPFVSYHVNSNGAILSATFVESSQDKAATIALFVEQHNKAVRARMQIGEAK